jgi:putative hydrolase of the HAD superfamily
MESVDVVAVLFDFGGVMTSSPFDAFAKFERDNALPENIVRKINSTNPDNNAWALLERSEVDAEKFASLFRDEAKSLGYEIDGKDVLALLQQEIRPEMVAALATIKAAGFKTACLTNNIRRGESHGIRSDVMDMFDCVVESAVLGIRKPEIGFYTAALEALGVDANQAVFLDDLGINLKPARQMGMATIKVTDADSALESLEEILKINLR